MHERTLTLPRQKAADPARTETGRFRRWVRNKLPLVGALATSLAFIGASYVIEANPDSENVRLTEKMRAWDQALVQGGECGDNYRKVLDDVRKERSRLIKTGNTEDAGRLLNIENILENAHQYDLKRGICPGDASH